VVRSGRPRYTTSATDYRVAQIATSGDRRESLRAITRHVLTVQGAHPSYITVCRRLREVSLKKRAPKPKPLITGPHTKPRLAFAQRHANDDWRNAAFHGEKKLYLRRSTKTVWRLRAKWSLCHKSSIQ